MSNDTMSDGKNTEPFEELSWRSELRKKDEEIERLEVVNNKLHAEVTKVCMQKASAEDLALVRAIKIKRLKKMNALLTATMDSDESRKIYCNSGLYDENKELKKDNCELHSGLTEIKERASEGNIEEKIIDTKLKHNGYHEPKDLAEAISKMILKGGERG